MGQVEDLRMFLQIVEQESISKAAEHFGIAKSAASRRLSKLEDLLGVVLITRTARQWHLSEAGRLLYDRALKVVSEVDDIHAELRHDNRIERGPIRLTVPLQFGMSFLNPVLLEFTDAHPQIHMTVDFSDRFADLIEENYDLAIRISRLKDSSLISRKLTDVARVFCASPDYLQSAPTLQVPQDLKNHSVIQYGVSRRFKWAFSGAGAKDAVVSLSSKMNTNNAQFLIAAARAGKGIIQVPEFLVKTDIGRGNLVVVLKDYAQEPLGMYALYPETRHLPHRVRVLLDFLSRRCGH
jgi:DNA-binding transcriptional LysR family regulator